MTTGLTENHKSAILSGRAENKAVSEYLDALTSQKNAASKRRRSPDQILARIEQINSEYPNVPQIKKLGLAQERIDLKKALEPEDDISELEEKFVDVVASYSERKGLTYSAWREMGVPANVLQEAGVPRTRASA